MSGNGDQNLFDLSENGINQLKKPELVKKILELKGRVTVDTDIRGLCDQIKNLTENRSRLLDKHEQLNSQILICKNVNKHLEKKVAKLEKAQAMYEQYSRRNNIKLARTPSSIKDNVLEETIINICKEHGIDISPMDIEACHRLPLGNAKAKKDPNQCKRVIVKSVNRKLPQRLLQIKKAISSMSYNHLNITGRVFANTSLCPYYQFLWGQCKSLVNKKKIHQVFCLGDVVSIKLYETSHPKKIFHISDIPVFPEEVGEEE